MRSTPVGRQHDGEVTRPCLGDRGGHRPHDRPNRLRARPSLGGRGNVELAMDLKSPEEAELVLAPEADPAPRGTPIGRRVVLGLLAAGAIGVVAGSRIQNWLEGVVAAAVSTDGTGLSRLLP